MQDFPNLQYSWEGERREQQDTIKGILKGYPLALIIIYALLAVPFKSYLQPFIVMSAIPFGLVGAIWGHIIMALPLTILSMFGIVALSGVVVNDNLVLVVYINRQREQGLSLLEAVRKAGVARFRPILLTSLTTFVGLVPLILEKSVQAQFLVPMAISLAFGVMFATAISLILVPAGYLILEDLKSGLANLLGR
jgi:multidrug efflux pump subunit AcrB